MGIRRKVTQLILVLLGVAFAMSVQARHGRGAASAGGSTPNAPTNVQIILQGTAAPNSAAMFQCASATAACPGFGSQSGLTIYFASGQSPNLNQIGWQSVPSATNYAVYRSTNGGSYTQIATVAAATAGTNYTSYVTNQGGTAHLTNIDSAYTDSAATNIVSAKEYPPLNATGSVTSTSNVLTITAINNNTYNSAPGTFFAGQGISGPGIPINTVINAFGSGSTTGTGGTGTYQLSNAATSNSSGTYGTQYFTNASYTYYVEAQVGGVFSSPSAFAILPYVVNGQYILSGGVFGGPATTGVTAPATTPLGYGNALDWNANGVNGIGVFAGNSAADQALNINGYAYIHVAIYTTLPAFNFFIQTEVPGDNVAFPNTQCCSGGGNLGFPNATQNAWTEYKIPTATVFADKSWSGTNIVQNSMYKFIITSGTGAAPTADTYIEMWYSVN